VELMDADDLLKSIGKKLQVVQPMDADDWLKSIGKKLQVVQCNNHEKVLLASHQLSGPTADWWDAYVEAHEQPESIN
jgi:hypothetical protein